MKTTGLTLLEVMLALMVVGIIAAAATPLMAVSMRTNSDSRVRTQALTAAETWMDRFRAKTLDFGTFSTKKTYDFNYDYASDATFVAAGDPDPQALNRELQPYKFDIQTVSFATSPLIWQVRIRTYYHRTGESDKYFDVATLVEQ